LCTRLMCRFVVRERDTLDSDNVRLEKTIGDELESMGKKAKYLEKQFNEANSQLRDIVSDARRTSTQPI
jgi:prefoldin subunit 1